MGARRGRGNELGTDRDQLLGALADGRGAHEALLPDTEALREERDQG